MVVWLIGNKPSLTVATLFPHTGTICLFVVTLRSFKPVMSAVRCDAYGTHCSYRMTIYRHGPVWCPRRRMRHSRVPGRWQSWLYDDDSLTSRLRAGCPQAFRVEVLKQQYTRAQLNEARALDMSERRYALLREVYLYCEQVRMVYARSVVPLTTLTGRQRKLASLGSRPLGGFLFSSPDMEREEIELAEFVRGDPIFARATKDTLVGVDPIWGRRSIFRLAGKPLLVAEIFLPVVATIQE